MSIYASDFNREIRRHQVWQGTHQALCTNVHHGTGQVLATKVQFRDERSS